MEQDWNLFFFFGTNELLHAMFATIFVTEQISLKIIFLDKA